MTFVSGRLVTYCNGSVQSPLNDMLKGQTFEKINTSLPFYCLTCSTHFLLWASEQNFLSPDLFRDIFKIFKTDFLNLMAH